MRTRAAEVTQEQLQRAAERLQVDAETLTVTLRDVGILEAVPEAEETLRPMTGAEALAYWQKEGVLGLLADRPDSPEYARELRQAETRDLGI